RRRRGLARHLRRLPDGVAGEPAGGPGRGGGGLQRRDTFRGRVADRLRVQPHRLAASREPPPAVASDRTPLLKPGGSLPGCPGAAGAPRPVRPAGGGPTGQPGRGRPLVRRRRPRSTAAPSIRKVASRALRPSGLLAWSRRPFHSPRVTAVTPRGCAAVA